MSYAPLDSDSLFSTAFRAGPMEWAVWTAILASKDQDGFVAISPDALAALWTCEVGPVQKAWDVHASPDPKSKNKDFEGKRIIPMDDGRWLVVSHKYYREKHMEASRREASRIAKAKQRAKAKGEVYPEKTTPKEIPYTPQEVKSISQPKDVSEIRAKQAAENYVDSSVKEERYAVADDPEKGLVDAHGESAPSVPEAVQAKPKVEEPQGQRCGQMNTKGRPCKKWKMEGRMACVEHLQLGALGATPPMCATESCTGFAATPNTSFCMEHLNQTPDVQESA